MFRNTRPVMDGGPVRVSVYRCPEGKYRNPKSSRKGRVWDTCDGPCDRR